MKLRSTQISTFKQCPSRAYYRYERGLRKKSYGVSIDLEFGKMLHEAIENFHKFEDVNSGLEVINEWELPFHKVKNQNTGRALYLKYTRENPVEVLSFEKEFSFKIGNHDWFGRFDGIGKYNDNLYVLEHKTTNPRFLQTKPNDQFIAYWAGAMIFYHDIAGLMINSLDPSKIHFERHFVNFSMDEFYEWRDEMKVVAEYYARCKGKGKFPRYPQSCTMYNRLCPFHEICCEPEVSREVIIQALYEVDEEALNLSW